MLTIDRLLSTKLIEMAGFYPVVTLIGPRQSGKTTLVMEAFPDKEYVSLEDIDNREFAKSDPREFLGKYPNGAIIDEVQHVPELLSYIQTIVDKDHPNGKYILTGSHQLSLHASVSQSLAGRTAIMTLLPLSLQELTASNIKFDSIYDYIYKGFYPKLYKNQNLNPTNYYGDYLDTYVSKDVRQMINVKDLSLFISFIRLCASRAGQVFVSSNVANELGITHHTVNSWLSILEASYIVYRLQPYFESFGKRIIKSPKLYFRDVGFLAYLLEVKKAEHISVHPLKGALMENLIVNEISKGFFNRANKESMYYYRDNNRNEVDVILKNGHQFIPVEIKASSTFRMEFLKQLKYYDKITDNRCVGGYLVYTGQQEQKIDKFNVINFLNTDVIPKDWS